MTDVASAPAVLQEVRVLEGPNLYFPRPTAKLTVSVPGLLEAEPAELQRICASLGFRAGHPHAPMSQARTRYVARLLERVLRAIARSAGTSRLGIRVRLGGAPYDMIVAFALRHRGLARALADAYVGVLAALPGSADPAALIAQAGESVRGADPGELLRPLRPKIPVVAVTGTNGKTTTTRLIAHIAMTAGMRTGWSSTDGVLIQGELVEPGDYSGPAGARTVLADKEVEFAVLETARGGMLLKGLGVAYNDVAVVTNVSADHLGMQGIDTVDQLAEVKAIITHCTKPTGWVVLNGEDPRVWAMRGGASAPTWCFAIDPETPALRESLAAHGRAITVLDGNIAVLRPGHTADVLLPVTDVPVTLSGLSAHNIANALAAAAAALGAGIAREDVLEGLRTFTPDPAHNAGRMNIYSVPLAAGGTATVIIDMAHNEGGLEALLRVANGMRPVGAEMHLGLGTGGDRTDEILHNLGEMAALSADQVQIVHKEHYLRNRTMEDLEAHLRDGLARAGVTPVASSPTELDGLQSLLAAAHDGDVIAEMVHQDRALLHDWLLAHGASVDDARAIRRKVLGSRGEHEAEARIAALWATHDDAERLSAARALAADYPGDARVTYELAGAYDAAGQEDSAIALYDDALAGGLREPYRRRAAVQRASSLRVVGRTDEAVDALTELAAKWPENIAIGAFEALARHDSGDDAGALQEVLRRWVTQSTDVDVDYYRRALLAYIDRM